MNKGILDHGQWVGECKAEHMFDENLANELSRMLLSLGVKYVLDLGCGPGWYTRNFRKSGLLAHGVDGNPNTVNFEGGLQVADLATPQSFPGEWDAVMSLEVGEHIPKAFEQAFLDNIAKHSKKWVILSWGIPGQSGYGHVNCQTNEYIVEQMKARGFTSVWNWQDILRKGSTFYWFKNTIMVFEKA